MQGLVHFGAAVDGTPTYQVDHTLADLPAVRGQDILAAWDSASRHAGQGPPACVLRFRRTNGDWSLLCLQDRDALRWADASDRMMGIHTSYGLSVCLRLLALIDLLARAPWAGAFVELRGGVSVHPRLLRLAAESSLTDDAGFDELGFERLMHGPAASSFA